MNSIKNNLFSLMQNSAISTIALHSFTLGYNNVAKNKKNRKSFPRLEYTFFVLPIVYNHESRKTFGSSNELYTALINNKSVSLGLQERAGKMAQQTFDGLNLAFSKNILNYNREHKTIGLSRGFQTKKMILPISMMYSENSVKQIQDCAYKLGGIFAKKDEKSIQIELNIKF